MNARPGSPPRRLHARIVGVPPVVIDLPPVSRGTQRHLAEDAANEAWVGYRESPASRESRRLAARLTRDFGVTSHLRRLATPWRRLLRWLGYRP